MKIISIVNSTLDLNIRRKERTLANILEDLAFSGLSNTVPRINIDVVITKLIANETIKI
jgi:hypothetical protein